MIDYSDYRLMTDDERADHLEQLILFDGYPYFLTKEERDHPRHQFYLSGQSFDCGGNRVYLLRPISRMIYNVSRKISFFFSYVAKDEDIESFCKKKLQYLFEDE